MTAPLSPAAPTADHSEKKSRLLMSALWIAVGSLIAGAIVCVLAVLIGDENGLIGKSLLTIVVLAGFAGLAVMEANFAPRRPEWFTVMSMVGWVLLLIIGIIKIWGTSWDMSQVNGSEDLASNPYFGESERVAARTFEYLFAAGVVVLALVHQRLIWKGLERRSTPFTRILVMVTSGLLGLLALMVLLYLAIPRVFEYPDIYGRGIVSLLILVTVGTALLPLTNALFAPKRKAPPQQQAYIAAAPQAWPTFGDGITPLPMLPDGSPDWAAGQAWAAQQQQWAMQQQQQQQVPQPQVQQQEPLPPTPPRPAGA